MSSPTVTPGDAAVALAIDLVQLDNVNPDLVAGAAGERSAVDLLARRLGGAGFEIELVDPLTPVVGIERPSLVATRRGTGGGRSLVLNGHLDTVGTEGMPEPFEARVDGDLRTGRLLGRGACDMKGGIAALVAAAEHLHAADEPLAGDIVLVLVADEENASVGTEAVIAHLEAAGRRPDGCIVAEPTWLDLVVAHRGFTVTEVRFTGRAAHSSQPANGVNALTHLGRLLAAVEAHDSELARAPGHPHAGVGSLMATVARSGDAPFTLPAAATAVIERRTLPGEPATIGFDEVRLLLDGMLADDPTVDAVAELVLARPAWQVDPDAASADDLLRLLNDGLVGTGRPEPARSGAPYWMESALWEAAMVPTVVCGPAGGGMHAVDEWLDLAQLRAYTDAVVHTIRGFCGPPPT